LRYLQHGTIGTHELAQHLSNVAVDYQNGIFAGNNDLVERIGGKKPTTVQEFITDHLAAFTS
jgi:NAD(P)H dehydrogenase (quinone)